jgi:hypothetical protein
MLLLDSRSHKGHDGMIHANAFLCIALFNRSLCSTDEKEG